MTNLPLHRYLKFDTEMREISVSWRDVEALLEDYAEEQLELKRNKRRSGASSRHNSGSPVASPASPPPIMTSTYSIGYGWDAMMDRFACKEFQARKQVILNLNENFNRRNMHMDMEGGGIDKRNS